MGPCTRTHSEGQPRTLSTIIFSFSARPSDGLTPPARNSDQLTPTSDTTLRVSSTPPKQRNHGSESSKSSPCSEPPPSSPPGLLDGQTMDTQASRDHTTALQEPTSASVESSVTHITELASTLESRSQEPTERSCQDSGSTKLVHASESLSETSS